MAVEIISFEDRYWNALREFLNHHWKENHPVCKKELFYWQYRGGTASKIAVEDGQIVGFLGVIPGKYELDDMIISGGALAIWIVIDKYRNSGLGILLLNEVEKENDCVVCLGVNKSVVRFYEMRGYQYLDSLNRYVIPLNYDLYGSLVGGSWSVNFEGVDIISPNDVSVEEAFHIWQNFMETNQIRFALHRDMDFWNWRYKESVGFEYLFFSDGENLLIGRFDEITGTDNSELNTKKVFRIIEMLVLSECENSFLKGCLLWAQTKKAILADFQISSRRFEKILFATGFKIADKQNPITNIPSIFTPIRYDIPPINLVIKLPDNMNIAFDDTYFVKSDGDMDRPIS